MPAFELLYSSKRCNCCLRWPDDCLYGSLAARHYAGSLGTLSKDDDGGSENVGKKNNLRSFKVNHVFGPAQYVKMQATFPEVEFLRISFRFKKRKENSSYVHVLHETAN